MEDKIELTASYFKEGLQQNECCIWLVPDLQSAELATKTLQEAGLDVHSYIKDSRLEIIPLTKAESVPEGRPEAAGFWTNWKTIVPEEQKTGCRFSENWGALRINLEVKPSGKSVISTLREFRQALAENMPGKAVYPLFTVPQEVLSPEEVFDLIEAEEKVLIKRDGKWKFLGVKQENSDKKFKTLFESSSDSILIHDLKGRVLEANHVACELFGYTRNKMLGKHIKDLRTNIHLTEFVQQIQTLKQTGYFIFEMDSLRRDGKVIPQEINNRLIEYEGKTAVLSIGRDISERRRTEEALRDSERKYHMLFEEFPGGIAQFDREGIITICNENFVNLTGSREIEKISFNLLSPSEEKNQEEKIFACLPEVPIHYDIKYISSLEKGSIPVEITYKPLISENFRLSGGIVLVEDLTEVKRLEIVRLQQTEALKKLIDSIPAPVFCKDRNGFYVACNQAFETFMGVEKEEILGNSRYDFASVEVAEKCHLADKELVKHGKTQVYEASLKFADGSMHQIIFNKFVFSGVTEEDSVLFGIMIDITERKQAEEKMLQAKMAAEAANHAKTTFVVNMSHELRTPLNSVIGFSDLLLSETFSPLNQEQKKFAENIFNSGKHLLEIINDVLDISRLELGNIELCYEVVDVLEVIEEIKRVLSPLSSEKNIRMESHVDKELKTIIADRVKFKQILYNLLNNAIKFSSEGGKVSIRATLLEDWVEISVKDEGIGIKEIDYERVFEPFVQIEESISRKYGGVGLGLALVKRFVKLHGGEVWVTAKYGKGSTFTFKIPKKPEKGVLEKNAIQESFKSFT